MAAQLSISPPLMGGDDGEGENKTYFNLPPSSSPLEGEGKITGKQIKKLVTSS
jgi:hypothetical protein